MTATCIVDGKCVDIPVWTGTDPEYAPKYPACSVWYSDWCGYFMVHHIADDQWQMLCYADYMSKGFALATCSHGNKTILTQDEIGKFIEARKLVRLEARLEMTRFLK